MSVKSSQMHALLCRFCIRHTVHIKLYQLLILMIKHIYMYVSLHKNPIQSWDDFTNDYNSSIQSRIEILLCEFLDSIILIQDIKKLV